MTPAPAHVSETWRLPDGRSVTLRPVRPDDADRVQEFIRALSSESRYTRFFRALRELPPALLASFVHVDPTREVALVALSGSRIVADARYVADADGRSAEFAVVVADDFQRQRLGSRMLKRLTQLAARAGIERIVGETMATNQAMLKVMERTGFHVRGSYEDRSLSLGTMRLAAPAPARAAPSPAPIGIRASMGAPAFGPAHR